MRDDELRAGLDALADGAPTTGDLAAIRSAGIRKTRQRSAAMVATALVVVLGAGFAVRALLSDASTQLSTGIADESEELVDGAPEVDADTDAGPPPSRSESDDETDGRELGTGAETEASATDAAAPGGDTETDVAEGEAPPAVSTTMPSTTSSIGAEDDDGAEAFSCQADSLGVVTWTDAGRDRYGVYRSTDGGDTYTWLARTLGPTSYVDPDFEPGYRYRIEYDPLADRTRCGVSIDFACRSDTLGVVGWSDGVTPVRIERSTDGGVTFVALEATVAGIELLDTDFEPGARYRVTRDGSAGPTPCSVGTAFTCRATGSGRIVWSDAGQDRYRVYRSDGDSFTFLAPVDDATTFVDPDHESGQRYRVDYDGLSPRVDCRDL